VERLERITEMEERLKPNRAKPPEGGSGMNKTIASYPPSTAGLHRCRGKPPEGDFD
jgi:hypothetical protein